MHLYWSMARLVLVRRVTYIRLLLCVGIKVADECQISLGYVRGYLDLRAWSLRLRA